MNGTRNPVELRETGTEFLLFIHASQKDRAKNIDGRRWDMERRCWVYPKTARVYDAIIAEFGDDMVTCSVRRPSPQSAPSQTITVQEENVKLRAEIGKIRQTLELISEGSVNGSKSQIQALEAALAACQSELSEVRTRLQERERQFDGLRKSMAASQAEIERLRAANTTLQTEASRHHGLASTVSVEELCRQRAKEATGNDPLFAQMIDRLRLEPTFPIELGKCLERELRELLNCEDRSLSFADLITQAKDAELLPEEAIDLAHAIRKQRNKIAHDRLDPRTCIGRTLFVLFAASILWPQLPDKPT